MVFEIFSLNALLISLRQILMFLISLILATLPLKWRLALWTRLKAHWINGNTSVDFSGIWIGCQVP